MDPNAFPDLDSQVEAVLWGLVDYGKMCSDSDSDKRRPGFFLATDAEPLPEAGLHLEPHLGPEARHTPDMGIDLPSDYDQFNAFNLVSPDMGYLLDLASTGG